MNIFKRVLDSLFPENFTCELCGTEIFVEEGSGERLCARCVREVTFNDGTVCPVCGRKTKMPVLCLECKAKAPVYDRAASAIVYENGGQVLVQRFKDGSPYLKEYFADLMAKKCVDFNADAIVFVPMTAKAQRRRGYNQAELLAKALSKRLGLPVLKDAIIKRKPSEQQKQLSRREREKNLKSCFRAKRAVVLSKKLIVVDDIMTTGATADEVCAELKKRGASKLYFVTVASVEYKTEM